MRKPQHLGECEIVLEGSTHARQSVLGNVKIVSKIQGRLLDDKMVNVA